VAAAGAVAGMLFAGGAAHAVTDTIFRYSTPKTGFVTIQSIAFNPDASGTAFHSAIQLTLDVAGAACFLAPVNMPQGAKMSALQIWYKRATPNFFTVALFRQHITQESSAALRADPLARAPSPASGRGKRDCRSPIPSPPARGYPASFIASAALGAAAPKNWRMSLAGRAWLNR
jgi:hypothetical protein